MNWNEFLRTMTTCISFLALFGAMAFCISAVFALGKKRQTLLVVAAVICGIIAIFGFSVIGGMNWGPAQ